MHSRVRVKHQHYVHACTCGTPSISIALRAHPRASWNEKCPDYRVLIINCMHLHVYVSVRFNSLGRCLHFTGSPFRKVPPHVYTYRWLILPHTALFTNTVPYTRVLRVHVPPPRISAKRPPQCVCVCVYSQLPLGDAGMQTTMHATILNRAPFSSAHAMPCYMSYTCTDMSHTYIVQI